VTLPVSAQFKFGVKGGLDLAKAEFKESSLKSDNFTGFFIGPMIDLTIPIIGLGVDASLLYAQKGVKIKGLIEGATISNTVKQKGIDIPVNLKYNIGLGSLAAVYLAAGPDFFFGFDKDKNLGENLDLKHKKAQLGINVGAGLKLLNHLQVGVNYNMPLTDTAKFTTIDGIKLDDYKTKTWQLSVAYLF
jgi:opacity protein-like surface antigen